MKRTLIIGSPTKRLDEDSPNKVETTQNYRETTRKGKKYIGDIKSLPEGKPQLNEIPKLVFSILYRGEREKLFI